MHLLCIFASEGGSALIFRLLCMMKCMQTELELLKLCPRNPNSLNITVTVAKQVTFHVDSRTMNYCIQSTHADMLTVQK